MGRDFIKIAHLSDLHFLSGKENASHYKAVENDLVKLKPDVIVVTGDIVDNNKLSNSNFRNSVELAKDYLEKLCKTCELDQNSRLFVVPGNHDYRLKGVMFIGSKYKKEIFDDYFKYYFRNAYIQDINLVVGCFDSNTTNDMINFAQGKVLRDGFLQFDEDMKKFKNELSNFETIRKIVLLHHHPMPIHRAEIQNGSLSDKEMFLLLENGATFMREMLKHNIRLVFHGHKHYRGVSKVSIPIESDILSTIGIISAGSVGKTTDNEYSFNMVDFYDSGRVTVDYRILRGQGSYDNEGKPLVEFFSDEEGRSLCFQELKSKAPTFMKRFIYTCKISPDTGDLEDRTFYEDWTSNQNPCEHLEDFRISTSGMFTEDPRYEVKHPLQGQSISWKAKEQTVNGLPNVPNAQVTFTPKLDKEPISVAISDKIPNAFFFTKEDRGAVTKERPNEESIQRILINSSAEKMIINVQFPSGFKPINPRVEVADIDNNPQHKEQLYCNKSFSYSEILNCAFLSVDFPLFQRSYKIVWDLPSESDVKMEGVEQSDLGIAYKIINSLLGLKPYHSDTGKVRNCLKKIYEEIEATEFLSQKIMSEGGKPPFEVGIIVYDKDMGRLRYVAYFCPEITKPSESNIWKYQLIKGQSVSGLALRRNEIAKSFHVGVRSPSLISQYIRKPESLCESCLSYFTAIVAIPLTYPFSSKNVIGILELSSCSNLSGLLKLDDSDDNQKRAKAAALSVVANTKFLNLICNAIGLNNIIGAKDGRENS